VADYFLDTSALAKLYHQENGSDYMDRILEQLGSRSLISHLSIVELESALAIKTRTGEIDEPTLKVARRRFRADLASQRLIVAPPVHEGHFQSQRKPLFKYELVRAFERLTRCSWPSLSISTAWAISPRLSRRTKRSAESPHWQAVPQSILNNQVQS